MKKLFSKLGITVLAFAFGITATALWIYFINPKIESYEQMDFSVIPTVKQCDLNKNPRKYNGKIIRIDATLNWFMHGYFLADGNCSTKDDTGRIAIDFYDSKRDIIWKKLELYREYGKMWEPVRMIAVGRFTYKNSLGDSDHIQDRTHLQLEIYEIESIEK